MARVGDGGDLLKCSFCGKSQKQVKKLIAGPGVYATTITRPGLFHAYVSATPAVVVGNDWLLGFEEKFAKANKPLPELTCDSDALWRAYTGIV